jgi:uncharacterized protein (TIGR04255 family)
MATERHLESAPITEAIIDFRVKLPREFAVEQFDQLKDKLLDRYPQVTHQRRSSVEIRMGQPRTVQPSDVLTGLLFTSEDGLNIAQFRMDGFTFNRLRPYTKWERVFEEALDNWMVYVETARPEFITRIATRYINHLALPVPRDFSEYLVAAVSVPPGIHGRPSGFLTRMKLEDVDGNISATITQALDQGKPGEIIVRLDIDVYRNEEIEVDDPSIPSYFSSLRNVKNQIFFNSITEDAARFFE